MAVSNDFASSTLDLNGQTTIAGPTALVWGPDGRLYVTEVGGTVKVLTVAFGDPDPNDGDLELKFYVESAFDLTSVIGFNFNDDGASNPGVSEQGRDRQVTGIDVVQQYDANGDPVFLASGKPAVDIFVTSSDPRHGAGNGGQDKNLDTNSGVVHRLRETADVDTVATPDDAFQTVDLVRGFARSEENHSINGLEVIQEFDGDGKLVSERAIVAVGGNANTGAPSNNFAGQAEYATSAAIFEIDITMLDSMGTQQDETSPGVFRDYIYDLPTLDDPTQMGADDTNDPFGGNDGFNGTKLLSNNDPNNPVTMYSPGYRNSYDVEITDDGRVWTYDNGANNSWGGRPIGEAGDDGGIVDNPQAANYIATNLNNGDGNNNDEISLENWDPSNNDNFHEITRSDDLGARTLSVGGNGAVTTYTDPDTGLTLVYGGHPNPTRAEGSKAGLLFTPKGTEDDSFLLVSSTNSENDDTAPSDYDEVIAWFTEVENNDTDFPTQGVFGADAGELTGRVIEATPGVLYDIYEETNGQGLAVETGQPAPSPTATFIGTAGLPADIHEIVATANPIEGNYLEAGATDGALDSGGGSINGLAEYTSTVMDSLPGVKMSGAILASQFNGGGIIVMGRNADGTMSSVANGDGTLAADRTIIPDGAQTLGLATIGDDFLELGLNKAFQGSIWLASYKIGQNFEVSLEVLQPQGVGIPLADQVPTNPTDQDNDGVDYINDPFDFNADNGYALSVGETININFEANDTTSFPGSFGGLGLMGAALDGTTPNQDAQTPSENFPVELQREGLFNDGENLIPGGNAPVFQIKNVVEGTVVGTGNTARDAMHTGVKLDPGVKTLTATINAKNWVSSGVGGAAVGQLTGMMLSDGTQSNFLRIVFGGVDGANPGIEVGYEIGDANYTTLAQLSVPELLDIANQEVELRLTVSGIGDTYDVGVEYKLTTDTDFTTVPLNGGAGFQLPPGVLQNVLDGTHTISDGTGPVLTSGAAIGLLAETPAGQPLASIDFNGIVIEGRGNEIIATTGAEVGTPGTDDVETVVYVGTDTVLADMAPNVENFDGTGSDVGYSVVANDLDNRIAVGIGANTIETEGGSDTIIGTIAQLSGDEIVDMSVNDKLVITDLTTADVPSASYAVGSAELTIGGGTITFSGPDFADFEAADGPSVFRYVDGPEGLEVTVLPPSLSETVVYRINFGADSQIAAVDGGIPWADDVNSTPGFSTNTPDTFTTGGGFLTVDYDNVDPAIVPAAVFNSERGDNVGTDAPSTLNFDVEVGKTYRIEYFYTENWQGSFTAEPRIFDVSVEGVVPAAFQGLQPLAEAEAFVVANGGPTIAEATASGGAFTNAEKNLYLNVARKAEYVYTATDNVLNLALIHNSQNPKVNAVQISEIDLSDPTIAVSILDAPTVVEAGDTGDTVVTFALEVADQGFTGDLTLDFDVTVAGVTQNVVSQVISFVDSDATIDVTVANDIQNNGAEDITVTLLGVAEAGYSIDAAAATGTSAVTEDDAPVAPGFPFVEATDGDLSDDRFNPTDLGTLSEGDNLVTATQQGDGQPGDRDRDYFTFEVPTGQVLTELVLTDYIPGEIGGLQQGFMGLSAGSIMDVDPLTMSLNIPNLLGGKVYSPGDIGFDLLPDFADGTIVGGVTTAGFALPLGEGTYTLWFNQGGEASTPTINLKTVLAASLPAVSIAAAPTVAEDGDTGDVTLLFPVSVAPAAAVTLDLTFTADGGAEETQSVVFDAAGNGTLSVAVANDAIFTGDRDIDVALVSAESATQGEFYVISDTSGSATGTVTDDELLPTTAPTEDFDGDGTANQDDTDIDGDAGGAADNSTSTNGVLDIQESFIFDATNSGTALTAGQVVRQEFDLDGTPFMNGFTGALLSPNAVAPEVNLNNANVSGGTLNITATNGDHFNNTNDQENAFIAAYTSPEGISAETRFAIPDFDPSTPGDQAPANFQAAGVVIGVDQNNMVKAVWGRAASEFQLVQDFGADVLTDPPVPAEATEVMIRLSVFVTDIAGVPTPQASALATFFDGTGAAIAGSTDIDLGTITLVNNAAESNQLATLIETGAPIGAGVIQTSVVAGPASFDVSYEYFEVTALGTPQVGDVAPVVTLTNPVTSIPEDQDLTASFKVADITITDDGLSTVTPTLAGADVALFEIVDNAGALELHLKAGVALDFETNPQLDVTVQATDAVGTGADAFTAAVTDANDAPTISGAIAEQATDAGTATSVDLSGLTLADEDAGDTPAIKVLVDGVEVDLVDGFSYDAINGSLEVADTVAVGSYAVEVFATDGSLDSESAVTFDVTVNNPNVPVFGRGDVLQAWNAGGGEVIADGITFAAATNNGGVFAGGQNFTDGATADINNGNGDQTFANPVFETEVNSGGDNDPTPGFFTATLDVTGQDSVFLDLYFAEIFQSAAGARVFNVSANGVDILTGFDVIAETGDFNTPIVVEIEEPIVPDANGEIELTFTGVADRSKVSAIVVREVVQTGGDFPPTVALSNVVPSIPEDQDLTASFKVADITITDDGLSTVTPSLSGDDAALFTIVDNAGALELHLIAGAALDFETNPALDVTVEATDAFGTGSAAFSAPLGDVNEAPTITGPIADASTDVGVATTVDLSTLTLADEDTADTPTLKVLVDGVDIVATGVPGFILNGTTLEVADTVITGDYAVEVFATDGALDSAVPVGFTVSVGADATAPAPTLTVAVPSDASGDIVVTVDFGEPVFNLDPADITLTNTLGLSRTDGTSPFVGGDSIAVVTFAAPPEGFAQDTDYGASIPEGVVLDGAGNGNTAASAPTVAFAIDDAPGFVSGPAMIDLAENTAGVIATYEATDPDGDTVTYTLDAAGLAAGFSIDANTGALTAPAFDFETPPTSFNFSVIASSTGTDGVAKTASQAVAVEILNEDDTTQTASDDVIDIDEDLDVVVLSNGGDNNGGEDIVLAPEASLDGLVINNVEEGDGFEVEDAGTILQIVSVTEGSVMVNVDSNSDGNLDGETDFSVEISGSQITEAELANGTLTTNDFQVTGNRIVFAPVEETASVEFEVEDFDDVSPISQAADGEFFEENQSAASGGKVARLGSNDTGTATLTLEPGDGVIFGNNDIVITYFDESDGVSSFTLKVNGATVGTVTMNNDGGGNAAQSANIRTVEFEDVNIPQGAVVTIEGASNAGEFVRLDKISFTTSTTSGGGNPDNQAPIVVGTIDLSGLTQGDTINIPLEGVSPVFVDPDEDALTFNLNANGLDFLDIVNGALVSTRALTNQDVIDSATNGPVTVTVTATDPDLASVDTTFDVSIANLNDAPELLTGNIGPLDLATSDTPIAPIDATVYFDDPDLLIPGSTEALSYSATGLPPELTIDPVSGEITGTLTTPGTFLVAITATDTGGLSATANFAMNVSGEPVLGDPIRVQVEDFDNIADPGGFFVENQGAADENQVARLGAGGTGEATLDLDQVDGFAAGTFNLALGFFDENDGDSTVEVKLRTIVEGQPVDTLIDTIVFNADNGGNAAQASSFREVTLNDVVIPAGATLVLDAQAGSYSASEASQVPGRTAGNEFARLDYVELIPTAGNSGNFAPFPVPGFDTALEAPEGNADFSVANAFSDPEEDALTFGLTPVPGGDPLPDFLTIDAVTGVISMTGSSVNQDETFDFVVTATDQNGSGQPATQQFSLLVTDVPLPSVSTSVDAAVVEGIPGVVTVSLAGTPVLADDVAVRLEIVAGTSVPPATPGVDVAFDEFGATTIDVVVQQGSDVLQALVFADDGPIDDLESFRVEIVAANIGSTIDQNATQVPFAQVSSDSVISDADDAPLPVDEGQSVFAGGSVTFDAAASDTDADATALTVTAVDSTGTTGGTATLNPDGTVTVTADPGASGTITFGYTVVDDFGNANSGTETVTITNDVLISIEPGVSVIEDGDAGATSVSFALTTTPATAGVVDVEFSLDGGATTSVVPVTFDALGAATLTVDINGFNDAVDDGDDTATVTLVAAPTVGFAIDGANAAGVATITEDDTVLPDVVVLRINAFGNDVAANDGGLDWLGDAESAASFLTAVDNRGDGQGYFGAVEPGVPTEVLDTARSSDFPFTYSIPVTALDGPGAYRVKLYIAEVAPGAQSPGFRIFDSTLEGIVPTAFDDIDPVSDFGTDVGVLMADVTVIDGTLDIGFEQAVIQNPIINGIEIIKLGGDASDVDGPTASVALTAPVLDTDPLTVEVTLADLSGIDPSSLGDEDLEVSVRGLTLPATFVSFAAGIATYTVAAPAGGWLTGDDVSVTLLAGEVADLAPTPNVNDAAANSIVLSFGPPPADAALTGDLDGDTLLNNADPDIDNDGILNDADRAAYNDQNAGPDLSVVGEIELDFTTLADGTSPFEAGFDGLAQTADGTPEVDYATNNGAQITGGRLQFQTTNSDTNDAQNAFSFLADVSGGDFTFEGVFDSPVFGGSPLTNFAQYGLMISLTGAPGASTAAAGDFLKFTTGNPGNGLELSGRGSFSGTDAKIPYPAGVTETNFAQVELSLVAQNGSFFGTATYLDGAGSTLGVANIGPVTPDAGSLMADILAGTSSVQPAFAVSSTDFGGNDAFTVSVESLKLSDGAGDPPVDPTDAIAILQAAQGVDADGQYTNGEVGSAELRIMAAEDNTGSPDNIQSSNFGSNSFVLENTGDKQIAAVFLDFRDALYGDSVIDLDGSSGDLVTKPFGAQSGADATGVIASGNNNVFSLTETYFLPGDEPNPDPQAGVANGGFRGLLLRFDGSSGGFSSTEAIGFSGDMDPNSLANISKGLVDGGAISGWDAGGVSGAELIGSSFTVMFDDGTFATGYLGSDGTEFASTGKATQASEPNAVATVTVNSVGSGVQGVYGGTEPEIVVSGTPGATVLVTMSKGLNPVTNLASNTAQDVAARLQNSQPDFQVNNAGDFQTVEVQIGATGSVTLSPGAFDYNTAQNGTTFAGSAFTEAYATAPMVIAASVVDSDGQPAGPVDRVYLVSNGTPVDADPTPSTDGFFEGNGNPNGNFFFKIQMESAFEGTGNGGQDPNGDWNFVDAPDSEGRQAGFQGDGYYVYGSTSSTGLGQVQANEILEYTILIPEGAEGNYFFRFRASRDGEEASDAQNDAWLNFRKANTSEGITDYLIENGNEPEPVSGQYIKVFGGPNNGNWGYASGYDGVPGNPNVQLDISEAGLYTIQIAGRSDGFHLDWFELYKGSTPGVGASDSSFVVVGDTAPTVVDPIDDIDLVVGNSINVDASSAFSDLDGDDLDFLIAGPDGITIDEETGLITIADTLALGSYTATVTAFDDDNNQVSDTFGIDVVAQPPGETLTIPVSSSTNDWEEFGGPGSNDLELGANGSQQYVGLRFTGIDVPAGATIVNAFIRFTAQETNNAAAEFTVAIEDSDTSAPFSAGNPPQSGQRDYINQFTWNPVGWTAGQQYETPDLTTLVANAIGSDGVTNGNLSFLIDGVSGSRVADTFDTPNGTPAELVITYDFVSADPTEPEVVDPIDDVTLFFGNGITVNAASAFDDADGDDLDFSVTGPTGVSIVEETGVLTIADTVAAGTYDVTVTAFDDDANEVDDTFTLTINPPTAPTVVDPIDDLTLIFGNEAVVDVSAAFDDADGDDLDFSVTGPTGVSIVEETGVLTIADTVAEGTYTVTVTAFDDDTNEIDDSFTLTIDPVAPTAPTVVDPIDDLTLTVGSGAVFDASVAFDDADGDDLDFLISGPTGVDIDFESGLVTIDPSLSVGQYSVTVTAQDDDTNTISDTFDLTIASQPTGGSVTVSVATINDDWEQFGDGDSNDFELGENSQQQQWAAVRFAGIDIPDGATVTSAVVRFTAQDDSDGTGVFNISIEDTENSAPLTENNSPDPLLRNYVDEFEWEEDATWFDGQQYETPDLALLLNNVLGTDGVSGGAFTFLFDGVSGSKVADAFDTPGGTAPELEITYDFI